jgi:3-oxoadipate enol-lactonase
VTSHGTLDLPDGGWIDWDVRGTTVGGGPPILLLAPAAGAMARWGRVRDRLAERLEVISWDYRGTGRSSWAPMMCGIGGVVEDACALLDHLGVGRAHLYGESFGAAVGLRLAVDHPARVASLAMAGAPWNVRRPSVAAALHFLRMASCLLRPARDVQACLARGLLSRGADVSAFCKGAPARKRTLIAFALAVLRENLHRDASRVTAPSLVLAGRYDRLTPLASQRALARAIAGAELVVLDAGHAVSWEQPDEAAHAVLEAVAHRAASNGQKKRSKEAAP